MPNSINVDARLRVPKPRSIGRIRARTNPENTKIPHHAKRTHDLDSNLLQNHKCSPTVPLKAAIDTAELIASAFCQLVSDPNQVSNLNWAEPRGLPYQDLLTLLDYSVNVIKSHETFPNQSGNASLQPRPVVSVRH